jgi:hypothetical protein
MNDTSLQAYETEVRPKLGEKQAAVRRLLLAYPEGLTNAEIAKLLEWTINRVTPRTNELVKLGAVKDAGKRTCRVTGRTAHLWRLTYTPPPKTAASPQQLFPASVKVGPTQ